jgi:hypothetical protein
MVILRWQRVPLSRNDFKAAHLAAVDAGEWSDEGGVMQLIECASSVLL